MGDRLILTVKPAGAGHWSGNAFDPQRKQNYAINVRVTDKHMTTRGCVMGGFVCESMGWNRMHRSERNSAQMAARNIRPNHRRQFTNKSTPAATSVAIETR